MDSTRATELLASSDEDATGTRLSAGRLALRLMGVLFWSHYPTAYLADRYLVNLAPVAEVVLEASLLGVISGGLIWWMVLRPLRRMLDQEHDVRVAREGDLVAEARRQRFEGRLSRGVDMAETENQVFEVLRRALDDELDGRPAALLLADSSGSHLVTSLDTGDAEPARTCGVLEPRACPAIRSGHAQHFEEATAVDACPQLTGGPRICGALCVPMQAGGRAVGVLHLPLVDDRPVPDSESVGALVSSVGRRLGMLRIMQQTSHRANTDGLTGLLNRRTVEERAADALRLDPRVAIVLADLDRFKLLNDTHGHAAGDRALRAYAEVLRAVLRPTDLIARYGGEEFLLVMPNTDAAAAATVVTRVRSHLAEALLAAHVPAFTSSYGISDTSVGRDLAELIRLADVALYRAKQTGRDRAVVADPSMTDAAQSVRADVDESSDAATTDVASAGAPDVASADASGVSPTTAG